MARMTIRDIARLAGVSVTTVSRALNNHPNVSERARQEILEAAAESGWQVNGHILVFTGCCPACAAQREPA